MHDTGSYWDRFSQAAISRRRALAGAGVVAAGIGLAACGSGDKGGSGKGATTGPEQAEGNPKPGGIYTSSGTGTFAGVDPHNSVYGGAGIVPIVYNYLLRTHILAPSEGIIQDLASSHEAAGDKLTWVFKLRNDVVIQPNGTNVPARPLDSEDVKLSFERMMDPKSGSNAFTWLSQWVDKVDTPDKQTFRIITKSPYGWVLNNVGNNLYSPIVPKEWLTSADLKSKAVGAGPFMFKEIVEGSHATVSRNPTYYQQGKPYLDGYTLRYFADVTTQRTAFAAGQADYYAASNPDEAKELLSNRNDILYYQDPNFGFNSFWMNVKQKPWDDARVRRAVSRAINRQEFIALIGHGTGTPTGLIVSTMSEYALPQDELKTKQQPFDAAEAKKLFDAAAIKEFSFAHPTSSTMNDYVNIFVRQMSAAGVNAKADPQDAGTWLSGYFNSKLSASLSLNQDYQTPDVALQWFVTNGITGNNHYDTGYSDPAVDAAVTNAAKVLDETERKKAYLDAQRLIYSKDPPMLHLINRPTDALLIKALKGVHRGVASLYSAFMANYWLDR